MRVTAMVCGLVLLLSGGAVASDRPDEGVALDPNSDLVESDTRWWSHAAWFEMMRREQRASASDQDPEWRAIVRDLVLLEDPPNAVKLCRSIAHYEAKHPAKRPNARVYATLGCSRVLRSAEECTRRGQDRGDSKRWRECSKDRDPSLPGRSRVVAVLEAIESFTPPLRLTANLTKELLENARRAKDQIASENAEEDARAERQAVVLKAQKEQEAKDRDLRMQEKLLLESKGDEEEQRTGRCSDERHARLEDLLGDLERVLGRGLDVRLVEHRYILSTPDDKTQSRPRQKSGTRRGTVSMLLDLRGSYLAVAMSPSKVALKAVGADGYAVTRKGNGARFALARGAPYADDLVFKANMGEQIVFTATGKGCTVVALFRE